MLIAAWVDERYEAEVAHRPDVNIHKRTLETTWGQMQRKLEELLSGEPRLADETKCDHLLYTIECGGWVEEVGCEKCDFKVTGQKGPPWPRESSEKASGDPEQVVPTRCSCGGFPRPTLMGRTVCSVCGKDVPQPAPL